MTSYTQLSETSDTSDTASVSMTIFHRCSVARVRARGNQHVRSELGRCAVCNRTFRRRIVWKTRMAGDWESKPDE